MVSQLQSLCVLVKGGEKIIKEGKWILNVTWKESINLFWLDQESASEKTLWIGWAAWAEAWGSIAEPLWSLHASPPRSVARETMQPERPQPFNNNGTRNTGVIENNVKTWERRSFPFHMCTRLIHNNLFLRVNEFFTEIEIQMPNDKKSLHFSLLDSNFFFIVNPHARVIFHLF